MNDEELLAAAREWHDARKAFFAVPPIGVDPKERFPAAIWTRLGDAEDRLSRLVELGRRGT